MGSTHDVTDLLVAWGEGDAAAHEELIEAVYAELKQLAKAYLRRECANHSFAATALVHEAYLKLIDQRSVRWQSRNHFFGIAAQAMRRILVDRARATHASKRGGVDAKDVPQTHLPAIQLPPDVDMLALDEALSRLEAIEPRWSRLIRATVLRRAVGRGDRDRARTLAGHGKTRLESCARLAVSRNRHRREPGHSPRRPCMRTSAEMRTSRDCSGG